MEEERLSAILESLLFAAGEPVPLVRLQAVLESVPREALRKALADLALSYANGSRGIVLEEVAGGYQLRTAREHAYYVRKLLATKPPRLSRPLLETLAIIAYRQPITRPEIEQLRGVDCEGVLDTLLERRLVRIAGRKEAPGRPIVYASTPEFLEVFGLKDLASLPDLEEFRALQIANADAAPADPVALESGELSEEAPPDPAGADDSTPGEPARHGSEPEPPDDSSSHD
jgi:segregation and condensation protein B